MTRNQQLLLLAIVNTSLLLTACGGEDVANTTSQDAGWSDASFEQPVLNLQLGSSQKLTFSPVLDDEHYSKLIWESASPDIVSVNPEGEVTALSVGTSVISVSSPDSEFSKIMTVYAVFPQIDTLTVSTDKDTYNAGEHVSINVEALGEDNSPISSELLSSAEWTGSLSVEWEASTESFSARTLEPGEYSLKVRLGDKSRSTSISVGPAIYNRVFFSETNNTEISSQGEYIVLVSATKTDDSLITNPAEVECRSNDDKILTVGDITDDGLPIRTYTEGSATITCNIGNLSDSATFSINRTLMTSWSADDNLSEKTLCPSMKCAMNHIIKQDDGTAVFMVETPTDNFAPLMTKQHLNGLSFGSSLAKPIGFIRKTAAISGNPSASRGKAGRYTMNYEFTSTETQNRIASSEAFSYRINSAGSDLTSSIFAPSSPSGALVIEDNTAYFGNHVMEAINYDANGGAPAVTSDGGGDGAGGANTYIPDYHSAIYLDGSSYRSTTDDLRDSYLNLVNTIKNSQNAFGSHASSYFDQQGSNLIKQTFVNSTNGFTNRTIDTSACSTKPDHTSRLLYISQREIPSRETIITCLDESKIHNWIYDDSSSDPNIFTYASTNVPIDWSFTEFTGKYFMGVDSISDQLGGDGATSIMIYLGYKKADDAVKTHYGLNIEYGVITPITAKAVIGIEGDSYYDDSIYNMSADYALFNYVAKIGSRELWTPYGTLGIRSDYPDYVMNLGLAPFSQGVVLPFTYSDSGEKRQGLMTFSSGNADYMNYGYLSVFNSDLNRLP